MNAYELGKAAFHQKLMCAPALDKELMVLVSKSEGYEETMKLMIDWQKGWTEENLK